jgi:membrane protein DedA with SNARE-associated domain
VERSTAHGWGNRLHIVLHLVATYGYIVVLLVVMAESAGLPLPGETSLLVAGALAATGHLWLPGVIIAAAAGAILGDTAGYWVGRTSGLRLLRRHGHLLRFDERKLEQAERFFARHGEKAVFLGRFVPIGRIFSALLAGVSQMRYSRFLFWNATGGIVWAALMGTLGYLFGQQLPLLEQLVGRFGFGLLAALLLFIAARIGWSRRKRLAAWWAQARSQSLDLGALRQLFLRRWRLAAIGVGLAVVGGAGLALALLTDVM